MFEVISNPFEEMTQGVVTSGIGYIAEKSSRSFTWLLWLLLPLLLIIGVVFYYSHQDKKIEEEEKRKLNKIYYLFLAL